jgi:hypothetical protein
MTSRSHLGITLEEAPDERLDSVGAQGAMMIAMDQATTPVQ